ncbi:MAG: PatA/PatG family cyanobactin maturation protease, partial [Waterburya sp.]
IVYAIGTLGYDFGTEARRDSFKQLMPAVDIAGTQVPANPYDARQMVDYLGANLYEAKSLIWTLNLELTPIYAIEPLGSFGNDVYAVLQQLLSGQVQAEDNEDYIERVSIPGRITGRTVRLFSGQVVPVIEPQSPRGMYGWRVNTLVSAAIAAVGAEQEGADEGQMRRTLSSFLNRIYYDLRNLGQTSQDRALNFAATNAFQAAQTFSEAIGAGMELDSINVSKSPFCRMDSDCWDVQLKFFDPENSRRAKKVFRFTIDVSDLIPVTLGEVRSWSSPY